MKITLGSGFAAAMAAFTLSCPTSSSAATVLLTGGDTTDGLNLTGNLVGAVHWSYVGSPYTAPGTTLTFQGYTFSPYTFGSYQSGAVVSNIKISAVNNDAQNFFLGSNLTPTNAGFTNPSSPSAQDTALINLMNGGLVYSNTSLTTTVSNLTAGQSYNFNFILSSAGFPGRTLNLSVNGGATESVPVTNASGIYSVGGTAIADSNGRITNVLTFGAGGGPYINAFIVTSAIPEPGSFAAFAGLGVLSVAASRRRRR